MHPTTFRGFAALLLGSAVTHARPQVALDDGNHRLPSGPGGSSASGSTPTTAGRTIPRPAGYDPAEFDCSSTAQCRDATRQKPTVDARKMLDYAALADEALDPFSLKPVDHRGRFAD